MQAGVKDTYARTIDRLVAKSFNDTEKAIAFAVINQKNVNKYSKKSFTKKLNRNGMENTISKVNVVIMIGVAGSGKSTYIENIRKNTSKVTFSFESDYYRKIMYGSLGGNNHNKEIFERMNEIFRYDWMV